MVNDTVLYGLEMAMDIRFNRKLTKDDYVVPGGYEMVFGGRRISFDFLDYYGSIDNDDATILHCEIDDWICFSVDLVDAMHTMKELLK